MPMFVAQNATVSLWEENLEQLSMDEEEKNWEDELEELSNRLKETVINMLPNTWWKNFLF